MTEPPFPEGPSDEHQHVTLTLTRGGEPTPLSFPSTYTITDLAEVIEECLAIPVTNLKLLVSRLGLLTPPFKNPDLPVTALEGKRITVLGSTAEEVSSVREAAARASARHASRAVASLTHRPKPRSRPANADDLQYTFLDIRPLAVLPHPERSLAMLRRLAADPGIRATMRRHRFAVGLLTEMEPLAHTSVTHEGTSRILGLNRNKGEVIELRLRTDAHDGYRDYATVRRTLCHELTHNVHGPHDAAFWNLCRQIEREVESASGGRTLGEGGHAPSREDEDETEQDHGGWVGGSFVLGGRTEEGPGLSRRDILARAAEERARCERQADKDAEASGSSQGSS